MWASIAVPKKIDTAILAYDTGLKDRECCSICVHVTIEIMRCLCMSSGTVCLHTYEGMLHADLLLNFMPHGTEEAIERLSTFHSSNGAHWGALAI